MIEGVKNPKEARFTGPELQTYYQRFKQKKPTGNQKKDTFEYYLEHLEARKKNLNCREKVMMNFCVLLNEQGGLTPVVLEELYQAYCGEEGKRFIFFKDFVGAILGKKLSPGELALVKGKIVEKLRFDYGAPFLESLKVKIGGHLLKRNVQDFLKAAFDLKVSDLMRMDSKRRGPDELPSGPERMYMAKFMHLQHSDIIPQEAPLAPELLARVMETEGEALADATVLMRILEEEHLLRLLTDEEKVIVGKAFVVAKKATEETAE